MSGRWPVKSFYYILNHPPNSLSFRSNSLTMATWKHATSKIYEKRTFSATSPFKASVIAWTKFGHTIQSGKTAGHRMSPISVTCRSLTNYAISVWSITNVLVKTWSHAAFLREHMIWKHYSFTIIWWRTLGQSNGNDYFLFFEGSAISYLGENSFLWFFCLRIENFRF